MTDNEIIKALKICTSSSNGCSHNSYTCDDCYLKGQPMCSAVLHQDTIDLINRQQAEIERLKAEQLNCIEEVVKNRKFYEQFRNIDKANAIKEFAERLKEKAYLTDHKVYAVLRDDIDNLVKEMVGEE